MSATEELPWWKKNQKIARLANKWQQPSRPHTRDAQLWLLLALIVRCRCRRFTPSAPAQVDGVDAVKSRILWGLWHVTPAMATTHCNKLSSFLANPESWAHQRAEPTAHSSSNNCRHQLTDRGQSTTGACPSMTHHHSCSKALIQSGPNCPTVKPIRVCLIWFFCSQHKLKRSLQKWQTR